MMLRDTEGLIVDSVEAFIGGADEGDTIYVRARLADGAATLEWSIPVNLFLRAANQLETP